MRKKYIYIKHNPGRSQEIHESTNENMIETEVILELVKLITLTEVILELVKLITLVL